MNGLEDQNEVRLKASDSQKEEIEGVVEAAKMRISGLLSAIAQVMEIDKAS